MPRFYTVDEANALLPQLRSLLSDLQGLKQEEESMRQELESLTPDGPSNGHARDPRAMRVKSQQAARITRESEQVLRAIHNLDCVVKNVDQGLVDFPALRDGQEVYLCWYMSEPEVGWWHELDAGFSGRQPL